MERGTHAFCSTKLRSNKAGKTLNRFFNQNFAHTEKVLKPHGIGQNLPQLIIVYPYEMQQVYDYDTFSADDIMGEAEIDIQSMITSATAFGDAGMFGNMQIGKWLKSHDNALLEDSTVNIVDGKVKQEVSLKLQNVESGEIDLQLEWIPLDQ